VLHVLHDEAAQAAGKYRDQLIRGIEMQLQKFIPERAFEWSDIETRIEDGSPPEVIPKLVKSGSYDLLVMNIHGKRLIDRALVGSTAERTLRALAGTCPVLLIPPAKRARSRR
jgi:nucleotide-binding universal stress UspA family protein